MVVHADQGKVCMIVALAAELVHSGTALKMMPNVFGTKVIMLPAYACCILTKLGLALGLFISMVYVPVLSLIHI